MLARSHLELPAHHAHGNCRLHVPHSVDGRRHGSDETLANVGALGEFQNLRLLFVGDVEEVHIALAVHMHRIDERTVDGETRARVCGNIVETLVYTSQVQLVSRTDAVDLVARERHLLGARHLARVHGAGAFLQRDSLEVLIERLLPVDLPRPLGLALYAGARLQILLLRHIKGSTGVVALGATQVKAFHFVEDLAPLRYDAVDIHELAQMLGVQLSDRLAHGEGVNRDPQLVFFLLPQLAVGAELPLRLLQQRLIQQRQHHRRVVGNPERQRRTPLLQVHEVHVQVLLVFLGHLLDHVGVLGLRLPLGHKLAQELLETPADLLFETLLQCHALRQFLLVQVVVCRRNVLLSVHIGLRSVVAQGAHELRAAALATHRRVSAKVRLDVAAGEGTGDLWWQPSGGFAG
mmetsp:Transcript_67351/g.156372  ORF Transcript_67351/g.156372 Transcript_67351/m.156372 type:complete len:406 (-) Transcript_67351:340-1557(-)